MGESTCLVNTFTQLQENLYMKSRQTGCTQQTSAAKAGISIRSGRRIEKGQHQDAKERHWRTRRTRWKQYGKRN